MDAKHKRIYDEQRWYSEAVVNEYFGYADYTGKSVLEIGCAEGGGLGYFASQSASCWGIEYSESRYLTAIDNNAYENIDFINGDILKPETYSDKINNRFDYIIIRDVIEHVHDKKVALKNISALLADNGKLFLSFPPKYSPYAGHQQVTTSKLGRLPYLYLLPDLIYKNYLLALSQSETAIEELLEVKSLRLSIREFESILSEAGLKEITKDLFFIRPCYEKRFGLKRKRNRISFLPLADELVSTGALYLIGK